MKMLYDRYVGYLTAVCARYIPDDDDVKDILQEAFVKIFRTMGSFTWRGEGSLKAWMSRIVVNDSLKALRRKKPLPLSATLSEPVDEEEPAFAARFDERGSLPVPLARGELEVAFDGLFGAVHGVEAAAGRALDDQAAEQIGRHEILPRPEAFAAGVEVDAFEIPRRRARHEAEGPVVVGEPRLDLLLRRQSLLVGAPAGERRTLVRGDGRQHAESGSQIVSCELDGNPPRGVRRGLRHRDSRDWRWEGTGSRRWSGIVRRKRGGP